MSGRGGHSRTAAEIGSAAVHDVLRRHVLVDGYEFVLDLVNSSGCWIVDERDNTSYLDLFSFYSSAALGVNHPSLTTDEMFLRRLNTVSLSKPPNSGVYTREYARFVATFERVLGDARLPHYFFIEGGAAAVENALKVAFDWKSQINEAKGLPSGVGGRVLHLTSAFHGRTGYTMSLTNSDPTKVERFPQFDWPRIDVPAIVFPLEQHLVEVEEEERRSLRQAEEAFQRHPDDIACFIAEPIQGEGGDNHMRPEFLQAMQRLCSKQDALFILDEVQTGCGMTGTPWAYQQLGLEPDIVAFGKKLQVCGIMAGGRVDRISTNVFKIPNRINSTWGGSLTDMVRATRILEVIESDGLFERTRSLGQFLLSRLVRLAESHPRLVSNPRGRGLMCAIDLPNGVTRDKVIEHLIRDERIVILGCGGRSVRFRPPLTISEEELTIGCDGLDRVVSNFERTGER